MKLPASLRPGTPGRDLAVAGAALAGGLLLHLLDTGPQLNPAPQLPREALLIPLFVVCGAVALRRVRTGTSLTVGTVAVVADLLLGGTLATILVYAQVLYDACVYGPARLWRWLLRVSVALSALGALAGMVYFGHWRAAAVGIPLLMIGVLPVVTGISVRQYRDQATAERARAAAERSRAEQTARLAELDRRQAVSAERTRMARELHDVIANHLSAVAIHATAALSVRSLDRDQVDAALRVIRENSVQGLAEMRQMIGLLREPAPDDPSAPATGTGDSDRDDEAAAGDRRMTTSSVPRAAADPAEEATRVRLAELDRLVDRVRGAGLVVRTEIVGNRRPLPVSVDLAAYRIVQESLTNALKHGAGEATLVIGYRPDRVAVTVDNPLPEPGPAASADAAPDAVRLPAAGAGLIGMRERVALLDGRFDVGRHDHGWRVHAELPTGVVAP